MFSYRCRHYIIGANAFPKYLIKKTARTQIPNWFYKTLISLLESTVYIQRYVNKVNCVLRTSTIYNSTVLKYSFESCNVLWPENRLCINNKTYTILANHESFCWGNYICPFIYKSLTIVFWMYQMLLICLNIIQQD